MTFAALINNRTHVFQSVMYDWIIEYFFDIGGYSRGCYSFQDPSIADLMNPRISCCLSCSCCERVTSLSDWISVGIGESNFGY